jgi:hypothetical protein
MALRSALLLVCLAGIAHADVAEKAKKAATAIANEKDLKLAKQVQFAMNELGDADYGLPEPIRKLLNVLADDEKHAASLIDEAFAEESAEFVKKACGGATIDDIKKLTAAKAIAKCGLKAKKAAPATLAPSMRPAAVVFAAHVIDMLGDAANDDSRLLARWIAHYGRKDEKTAKPVRKP